MQVEKQPQSHSRAEETAIMKQALIGKTAPKTNLTPVMAGSDWGEHEERERLANLAKIRQHRKRR